MRCPRGPGHRVGPLRPRTVLAGEAREGRSRRLPGFAARRDGQIIELDATTGATLRTFDVGSDQLLGMTYAGEDILVGRATSAGDIWEAVLARE